MGKQYQVIKPKHGYYKGECREADIAPTIDTGIGKWHTLIGESAEEIKCEQVGILSGGKWEKCHETNRRVYSDKGRSPTITTMGGGQREPKIIEPTHKIRKLTERECFRLQSVKAEDFEKVKNNQSPSSLYHLAGDSINCTCLMAIFGELFGIDYNSKITELVEELSNERISSTL